MRELHLFAGAGGGILGGMLLGHTCVCAVELEPYCRDVLLQRQRDGILPRFPIWDDVRTFDGKPWRGLVDIVCGGFPCQDISAAGKGAGIDGSRSGLWSEMARIIGEVQPRYALVENSPMLTVRGLGVVLGDLAAMGYDARWGVVSAANAGAPHKRERIWILADAHEVRLDKQRQSRCLSGQQSSSSEFRLGGATSGTLSYSCRVREDVPDSDEIRHGKDTEECSEPYRTGPSNRLIHNDSWCSEPDVGRVADGVASRVDRLAAIGNGQVPAVVRLAWRMLMPLDAGPGIE